MLIIPLNYIKEISNGLKKINNVSSSHLLLKYKESIKLLDFNQKELKEVWQGESIDSFIYYNCLEDLSHQVWLSVFYWDSELSTNYYTTLLLASTNQLLNSNPPKLLTLQPLLSGSDGLNNSIIHWVVSNIKGRIEIAHINILSLIIRTNTHKYMLVDNTENNTLYYKSLYKPKAILHEVDLNNTKGSAKVMYLECVTKKDGSLSIKSENITSKINHINPYDEGWLFAVLYHLLNDSTKLT
jgi:hypothetical protein